MGELPLKSAAIPKACRALALVTCVAWPAFGAGLREDFVELLRRYARGERAQAISGLSGWSSRDLERQLQTATATERCAPCPKLTPVLLRAAVMLHADTDRAFAPAADEPEQPRSCPGRVALLAGRYAALWALRPEAGDFAPRFFLYMALRCQWDACLEDGLQWARRGIALFPRDARLLFAAGSILEETAVLGGGGGASAVSAPPGGTLRALALSRAREQRKLDLFRESRRFYESALKLDPEGELARLRLGIVSWRLRELDAAHAALREVTERSQATMPLFLAHLFLGRVHEDAGRVDSAVTEYRLALSLDPRSQSAAVALSHLLRLQGEGKTARQILSAALSHAPRRAQRDGYWDYLGSSHEQLESLLAGLHREAEGE